MWSWCSWGRARERRSDLGCANGKRRGPYVVELATVGLEELHLDLELANPVGQLYPDLAPATGRAGVWRLELRELLLQCFLGDRLAAGGEYPPVDGERLSPEASDRDAEVDDPPDRVEFLLLALPGMRGALRGTRGGGRAGPR